jgi:hypothetical protein
MEDMYAMNYEYLIRRAHQVGRFGVEGGDTDTFRALERANSMYESEKGLTEAGKQKQWNKSLESLAFEYGVHVGRVSAFINIAIEKVLSEYEHKLTPTQVQDFEQLKIDLLHSDLEIIKKVIDKVQEIMLSIGLLPK